LRQASHELFHFHERFAGAGAGSMVAAFEFTHSSLKGVRTAARAAWVMDMKFSACECEKKENDANATDTFRSRSRFIKRKGKIWLGDNKKARNKAGLFSV